MTYPLIATIVEGHGEVGAVPILVRRIAETITPYTYVEVPQGYRVPRESILKPRGLETALTVVLRRSPAASGILVVLDSDDDCAVSVADGLRRRAEKARTDIETFVVLPVREFEAWFLAAAPSLAGRYGLPDDLAAPEHPESIRGAKEWFTKRMPAGQSYQPTSHQAGFAQHLGLDLARANSPSFDKFCRDVTYLITGKRGA